MGREPRLQRGKVRRRAVAGQADTVMMARAVLGQLACQIGQPGCWHVQNFIAGSVQHLKVQLDLVRGGRFHQSRGPESSRAKRR